MIYQGTLRHVIDNSRAKYSSCIKVLNKRPLSSAHQDNRIMLRIKTKTPHKKVRKNQVHGALIVRDSKESNMCFISKDLVQKRFVIKKVHIVWRQYKKQIK